MSEKLTVLQRINEVRKSNDFIKKDKKVDGGGGYMAVTHDMVTASLRDDLVKHGVVIAPSLVEGRSISGAETGLATGKGTPVIRYEATFDIHFINVDDAQDKLTIRLGVHANDQGDKAPGKAISYAVKYAMLKVFSIETGEDDEGRIDTRDGGNMPAKEVEGWQTKINALPDSKAGENLWAQIKEACEQADDMPACTKLKGHLTAKLTALKKNGAKNGGAHAQSAQ